MDKPKTKTKTEPRNKPAENLDQVVQVFDGFDEDKLQIIKRLVPEDQSPKIWYELVRQAMGTDSKGELRPFEDITNFLYTCKRTGLDPITKQIYAVYRWNTKVGRETMTVQTGIDGMRLVAQRTKEYAGQDDVIFDPVDEKAKNPLKATVTVYKLMGGQRVPFTASARWAEYVQVDKKGLPMQMWKKMPYLMLGKCAEALALRKAFPNELSGLYSDDEMAQASNPLAGLPTPSKFEKPKVEVLHGAPSDLKEPEPEAPVVSNGDAAKITKEEKPVTPDLGKMRAKIKKAHTPKPKTKPKNDN